MSLEELLGAPQVLDLQEPVAPAESGRPYRPSDRVVQHVAQNRRAGKQHAGQRSTEFATGIHRGERPDGEQKRVSRQEGSYDQAGLGKDDEKQDPVDPEVVAGQQLNEMPIE